MTGPLLVEVDLVDLEEGWRVEVAGGRFEVIRSGGFLQLRDEGGSKWPLSAFVGHGVVRHLRLLPTDLGYYTTEDPDHELVERTSTAWRSTDVVGTPLSDAEVREMGKLEHYVKASDLEPALIDARMYREQAINANAELALAVGELAEARAQIAPSHAAGRAEALAEVWWFLRARGLWWRPVRRALARHFGRALIEMGEGR